MTGASDLLFQTSDTTWQVYNNYGGKSLYDSLGWRAGRYKVSYNRPFVTRAGTPEDWLFNAGYPMVRWLEANGYNVSYFSGVDADRYGSRDATRLIKPNGIQGHKVFLSVGHDDNWSAGQRQNVEAARQAGVHLAFFSGNEVFWKTRWEASIDGTATAHRTLVAYKDTHGDATDPVARTGTWRDPLKRRRTSRERADRHDLHGQLLRGERVVHQGARGRWQDALLAQHFDRHSRPRRDGHAAGRDARVRVG